MIQNKFGELIFSESDICNLLMQGQDLARFDGMLVDNTVDLKPAVDLIDDFPRFMHSTHADDISIDSWHQMQQSNWHMPAEYKNLDIAEYILSLCQTEAELQRCGSELLLYQERDLFNLLRYLKYLVDVMTANQLIWGVGRGSSVASYVLFLLKVHKIDSMYYNLDITEFLR